MKLLARVILLAGAVAVGLFLFRANPREVTLVYGLESRPALQSLEVEISRGGEWIRDARFSFGPGASPRQVPQRVRLPPGEYQLHFRLIQAEAGAPVKLERSVRVTDSETIVVPLWGPQ